MVSGLLCRRAQKLAIKVVAAARPGAFSIHVVASRTVIPFRDFGQQALPARSRRHWAEPFRASRIGLARGRKRLPPQSNLKGGIWPRPRRGLFSMKSSHRTINQVQSNRWGAARRPPRPATSSDRAHRRPAPLPQRDPHVDVSNPVLLNQRCPLALSFESMFRARMLKILLQQYLPAPQQTTRRIWN